MLRAPSSVALTLSAVLCLSLNIWAESPDVEKPSAQSVNRLQRIRDAVEQAKVDAVEKLRAGRPSIAAIQQINKERVTKLKELAEELEAAGEDGHGFEEHELLADLYVQIQRWQPAIKHAKAALAEKPNSPEVTAKLVIALSETDLDAAEAALADALANTEDDASLEQLHHRLYLANNRAGRRTVAAEHLGKHLANVRPYSSATNKSTYLRQLSDLVKLYTDTEKTQKALSRIDEEIALWGSLEGTHESVGREVAGQIQAMKIKTLARAGPIATAESLLKDEFASAQAEAKANPDDVAGALRVAALLDAAYDIAEGGQKAQARDEWLDFLADKLKEHSDSSELSSIARAAYLGQVRHLLEEKDGEKEEAIANRYEEALAALPEDSQARMLLAAGRPLLKQQLRRYQSERLKTDLIGKPMIPLETAAWVNGSPLSNDELKGKVILLDFWAVWCGPCRATFPHLTEWHTNYADDGLVIVGLTQYYEYGWDAESENYTKVDGLAPEEESAALEHFASHHGLKHRLAFIPKESSLSQSYAVSGIPQVVVIDRNGIIRMIRVGSGEKNAHDIGALLEELVHAPVSAAAGE